MSKRKLNKHQLSQVLAQQLERHEQAMPGQVVARYGRKAEVEIAPNQTMIAHLRQHLDVVVGDQVGWQLEGEETVIVSIEQRRSELFRAGTQGQNKVIAANVNKLCIVFAAEPMNSLNVIDRYLVLAELQNIQPCLVCTKSDLLQGDLKNSVESRLKRYADLGYPIFYASALQVSTLSPLLTYLENSLTVLVGLSGVGKSSILKAWLPEAEVAIGSVLSQARIGRHTTTTARLYHLPQHVDIIDSPGIRELSLPAYSAEKILQGFPELRALKSQCRFRNCQHRPSVQGCALVNAVEQRKIHPERWASYCRLSEGI